MGNKGRKPKIDLSKIMLEIGPSGLGVELEARARKMAEMDYRITVGPLFLKVLGNKYTAKLDSIVQKELFDSKVEYLLKKEAREKEIEEENVLFPSVLTNRIEDCD